MHFDSCAIRNRQGQFRWVFMVTARSFAPNREKRPCLVSIMILGKMRIPSDTYYVNQTHRVSRELPDFRSEIASFPELIKALGLVMKASPADMQFGLPREIGDAICAACDEIIEASCTISSPGPYSGEAGTDQHERQRGHRHRAL